MAVAFTNEEVRRHILRFLDGRDVDPWEWDDFISIPIKDKFLDAVRLLCLHVRDAYPPEAGSRHYCSEQGAELLRELANRLP